MLVFAYVCRFLHTLLPTNICNSVVFCALVSGYRRGAERCMISGSSILTGRPQCSVQCPIPGRWNRMYYSCLWGPGFEVSICIMKAERIRIVMLYGSLLLPLPLCLFFSCYLPCSRLVFLSVTLSLSNSIPFYFILPFFFCTLPFFTPRPHTQYLYTQTPSHLVPLVYYVHVSICQALWLIETGDVKRPHTHSQS